MDRNCLSYWFPKLQAAGVPVPRTEIVRTEIDLTPLVDGQTPDGWGGFLADLNVAIARLTDNASPTPPVFLRTGQTSGKHEWSRTCHLDLSKGTLPDHVRALVYFSALVDFLGLPTDVWVVREMLPVEPIAALPDYGMMPLVMEVRAFIRDGRVDCFHPYWPKKAILEGLTVHGPGLLDDQKPPPAGTGAEAERLYNRAVPNSADMCEHVDPLVRQVAAAFRDDGAWSVDVLKTRDGWYVTDMAEAARSFHWPACPNCPPAMKRQYEQYAEE